MDILLWAKIESVMLNATNKIIIFYSILLLAFFHSIQLAAREISLHGETRCGWFVNPTPSNVWLIDRDDQWIIGVQGGFQAEGDWPTFSDKEWVKTNINYGYGCACMKVQVDSSSHRILRIFSAASRPLLACRKDPFTRQKEPGE